MSVVFLSWVRLREPFELSTMVRFRTLISISVVMVLYYKAGSIYGQTSRDMRRLNSVTRSPLYSLFGETVAGVSVIRAFGASTIVLRRMLTLADTNVVAYAWTW